MPVHIDEQLCKACGLCIFYCPKVVLKLSDRRNAKGYNVVQVYQPENCTRCRLCEINCPDMAIYVDQN